MRESFGMRRLVALALVVLALPMTGNSAEPELARQIKHGLTIYTSYADHATTQVFDLETGTLVRSSSAEATGKVSASAPSNAQRCSNSGSYEEFSPGVIRPWRLSEPWHINPSGAPSHMVGDWRGQITEGKRVWELTRNYCGYSDVVIWDMPMSYDTSTIADPGCGSADHENIVGFANMGGWSAEGLVLARTCVWWNDLIYESDMVFNNHSDAKWANGAYANYWDLQSVAAHEFGHSLGLGHTETSSTRETARAVMHPIVYTGDTRNRTLSLGDIDGARALYPRLWGFQVLDARTNAPAGQKLEPGKSYQATVQVENTGYKPWQVGSTSSLIISTYPLGRCSAFAGSDWRSCSEPSTIDSDGGDAGGGPENNDFIVAQGEVAQFTFTFTAGWDKEGVASVEGFRVRGIPSSDYGDLSMLLDVGTYKASLVRTSGPGMILRDTVIGGTPAYASVTIRNDGTAPWYPGPDGRLRLMTHVPNRCSRYKGGDWYSCTMVSDIDHDPAVPVLPGEEATFDFAFSTPLRLGTSPVPVYEVLDVEVLGRPTPRLDTKATFRFYYY